MDSEGLCLSLVNCETEKEVINALTKSGFWDSPSCWRYFGDIEDNYSTIGNQQSEAEYALVEKIVNSVDALLMNKCLESGIDPKEKEAPKSISEALERYYSIPEGKLSRLSSSQRSSMAENIKVVATGSQSNPCYSIIDVGEGQTPESMPSTLLGLFKSIKSEIPFVQGKFHMGGTGAFSFCGTNHMQLVISKRNPKIIKPGEQNAWGFSIIRRERPKGTRRTSVYTYLAPNGAIPSFKAGSLPICPGPYPNKIGASLEWGTFIKLYEFKVQRALKTNIQFDLYYALSILLPNIALPVRLYERRKGYLGHSFETTLAGLGVRLEEDRRENLEPGYPTSHSIAIMGQKLQSQVYAFKKGRASNYRRNEGIVFSVNGQTHAHLQANFFQRDNVGMGYLKDSLLVIVNCSNIDPLLIEDLFMNSRDRFRTTELRVQIERELERILKEHPGLRVLRDTRRQEEINNKLQESKPLSEVIQKIIKNSPALAKLLPYGGKLSNPFRLEETGIGQTYEGEKYPTYFRIKKKTSKEIIRSCPINWRFRVQFETDASNDYFDRDDDPGQFILYANGIEVDNYTLSLGWGTANLTVSLPSRVKPNQIIQYKSKVKDATKWQPFEDSFTIKVDAKKAHQKSGGQVKPRPPDEQGTGKQKPSTLNVPNCIDIHRDKWEEHNFDEYDALDIVSIGEGQYDFYINVENICLQTELKFAKPSMDIDIITAQFRSAVVLMGMSLIRELSSSKTRSQDTGDNQSIPDKVKFFTRAISPILIPMIATLSQLGPDEMEESDIIAA